MVSIQRTNNYINLTPKDICSRQFHQQRAPVVPPGPFKSILSVHNEISSVLQKPWLKLNLTRGNPGKSQYEYVPELYVACNIVPSMSNFLRECSSELDHILKKRPSVTPKIKINEAELNDSSSSATLNGVALSTTVPVNPSPSTVNNKVVVRNSENKVITVSPLISPFTKPMLYRPPDKFPKYKSAAALQKPQDHDDDGIHKLKISRREKLLIQQEWDLWKEEITSETKLVKPNVEIPRQINVTPKESGLKDNKRRRSSSSRNRRKVRDIPRIISNARRRYKEESDYIRQLIQAFCVKHCYVSMNKLSYEEYSEIIARGRKNSMKAESMKNPENTSLLSNIDEVIPLANTDNDDSSDINKRKISETCDENQKCSDNYVIESSPKRLLIHIGSPNGTGQCENDGSAKFVSPQNDVSDPLDKTVHEVDPLENTVHIGDSLEKTVPNIENGQSSFPPKGNTDTCPNENQVDNNGNGSLNQTVSSHNPQHENPNDDGTLNDDNGIPSFSEPNVITASGPDLEKNYLVDESESRKTSIPQNPDHTENTMHQHQNAKPSPNISPEQPRESASPFKEENYSDNQPGVTEQLKSRIPGEEDSLFADPNENETCGPQMESSISTRVAANISPVGGSSFISDYKGAASPSDEYQKQSNFIQKGTISHSSINEHSPAFKSGGEENQNESDSSNLQQFKLAPSPQTLHENLTSSSDSSSSFLDKNGSPNPSPKSETQSTSSSSSSLCDRSAAASPVLPEQENLDSSSSFFPSKMSVGSPEHEEQRSFPPSHSPNHKPTTFDEQTVHDHHTKSSSNSQHKNGLSRNPSHDHNYGRSNGSPIHENQPRSLLSRPHHKNETGKSSPLNESISHSEDDHKKSSIQSPEEQSRKSSSKNESQKASSDIQEGDTSSSSSSDKKRSSCSPDHLHHISECEYKKASSHSLENEKSYCFHNSYHKKTSSRSPDPLHSHKYTLECEYKKTSSRSPENVTSSSSSSHEIKASRGSPSHRRPSSDSNSSSHSHHRYSSHRGHESNNSSSSSRHKSSSSRSPTYENQTIPSSHSQQKNTTNLSPVHEHHQKSSFNSNSSFSHHRSSSNRSPGHESDNNYSSSRHKSSSRHSPHHSRRSSADSHHKHSSNRNKSRESQKRRHSSDHQHKTERRSPLDENQITNNSGSGILEAKKAFNEKNKSRTNISSPDPLLSNSKQHSISLTSLSVHKNVSSPSPEPQNGTENQFQAQNKINCRIPSIINSNGTKQPIPTDNQKTTWHIPVNETPTLSKILSESTYFSKNSSVNSESSVIKFSPKTTINNNVQQLIPNVSLCQKEKPKDKAVDNLLKLLSSDDPPQTVFPDDPIPKTAQVPKTFENDVEFPVTIKQEMEDETETAMDECSEMVKHKSDDPPESEPAFKKLKITCDPFEKMPTSLFRFQPSPNLTEIRVDPRIKKEKDLYRNFEYRLIDYQEYDCMRCNQTLSGGKNEWMKHVLDICK